MKYKLIFIAVMTGFVAAAQTTHDAPLEIVNGSVLARFRADTLIDRVTAATAFNIGANQLAQHTHDFAHSLRVLRPHSPPLSRDTLSTDELYFRLRGPRRFCGIFPGKVLGYLTVQPDKSRTGIGGLVAGHAAAQRYPKASFPTRPDRARDGAGAVVGRLSSSDKDGIDLIWLLTAPSGFTWRATDALGDAGISQRIAAIAANSDHKAARQAAIQAPKPEYELLTSAKSSNFRTDMLFVVPAGGTPSGAGIPLPPKARVLVCENVDVNGVSVPQCADI